jgi:hypothetical protein
MSIHLQSRGQCHALVRLCFLFAAALASPQSTKLNNRNYHACRLPLGVEYPSLLPIRHGSYPSWIGRMKGDSGPSLTHPA